MTAAWGMPFSVVDLSDWKEKSSGLEKIGGGRQEVPAFPAEIVMNLSGSQRRGSHGYYNIYYSCCGSCRHKQCIMDQISLLNCYSITLTSRRCTLSPSWALSCNLHVIRQPGGQSGSLTGQRSPSLPLTLWLVDLSSIVGLTARNIALSQTYFSPQVVRIFKGTKLVLNCNQVCFFTHPLFY